MTEHEAETRPGWLPADIVATTKLLNKIGDDLCALLENITNAVLEATLLVDARAVHWQYNPNSPAIIVHNRSPYAIYDVVAELFAKEDPTCSGVRLLTRDTTWISPDAAWDALKSPDLNALKETGWSVDKLPNVKLTWTDSAGVRWTRMPDFTLEPIHIPT